MIPKCPRCRIYLIKMLPTTWACPICDYKIEIEEGEEDEEVFSGSSVLRSYGGIGASTDWGQRLGNSDYSPGGGTERPIDE